MEAQEAVQGATVSISDSGLVSEPCEPQKVLQNDSFIGRPMKIAEMGVMHLRSHGSSALKSLPRKSLRTLHWWRLRALRVLG